MKLIFLDIDGVMNHRKHFIRSRLHEGQELCPIAVRNLREILKRTGAKIVVSSTWRKMGMTRIKAIFRCYDMQQYIVGLTPVIEEVPRGVEVETFINKFINDAEMVESFVILDDDDDMALLMHHLVQTSGIDGLNDEKREEAIKVLTERLINHI